MKEHRMSTDLHVDPEAAHGKNLLFAFDLTSGDLCDVTLVEKADRDAPFSFWGFYKESPAATGAHEFCLADASTWLVKHMPSWRTLRGPQVLRFDPSGGAQLVENR
jgi:hypothetical protein